MTIIGLFRRYQRWNPVHPTYGAFWGMGIGLGCGVGWGPGFGPEAVGFVGGGCGIGFSVGLTFIGVGVGLPAEGITSLPCDALTCVTSEALNLMKMATPVVTTACDRGLSSLSSKASEMQKNLVRTIINIHSNRKIIESDVNRKWSSIRVDWEKKFRCRDIRSVRIVRSKGSVSNSGQTD